MQQDSRRYIVDLNGVDSRNDFYNRLARALPLPEWYGRNLDALYDVLTDPVLGRFGEVRLIGCASAEQALGGYFRTFCRVCREAEQENPYVHFIFSEDKPIM